MRLEGAVALVTGANRGIGAEFVRQLSERGVRKVYAAGRDVDALRAHGAHAVRLDVTDPADVAAAAAAADDVEILINNAGVSTGQGLVDGDLDEIRRELETNFFGPLLLARAFAPVLAANGGGVVLNVLSALSWFTAPGATSYSASKAAAWSLTDGLRVELAAQGTRVVGLHMGAVDTDMAAGLEVPKISTSTLVAAALDGVESDRLEVLADELVKSIKSGLHLDPAERYAALGIPVA